MKTRFSLRLLLIIVALVSVLLAADQVVESNARKFEASIKANPADYIAPGRANVSPFSDAKILQQEVHIKAVKDVSSIWDRLFYQRRFACLFEAKIIAEKLTAQIESTSQFRVSFGEPVKVEFKPALPNGIQPIPAHIANSAPHLPSPKRTGN